MKADFDTENTVLPFDQKKWDEAHENLATIQGLIEMQQDLISEGLASEADLTRLKTQEKQMKTFIRMAARQKPKPE